MYKTGTAMELPTSFEHRWTGFLVREPVYADCRGVNLNRLVDSPAIAPNFREQLFT